MTDKTSLIARGRPYGVGLLAGMVFALGQPPYDLWFVALAGLVVVFYLLDGNARAGRIGWLFGVGYFSVSLSWITEPFLVDAAATGWMAPFALIGLAGGLALFWGLACLCAARLGGGLWFAVFWAMSELARAYVLTGFPWGLVGYVWAPSFAVQWVSLIGPHGLTLVTLLLAWTAGQDGRNRRMFAAGGTVVLLLGGYLIIPDLQSAEDRPVVRFIQPNAPQHQKWDPAHIPVFFQRQIAFTEQQAAPGQPDPDLIVWPETALPMLLHNAEPAFDVISQAAGDVPVAVGVQRLGDENYFNAMALLNGAGAQSDVYDKHHLVPFGEYIPFAGLIARFDIAGLAARAGGGYGAGSGPRLVDIQGVGQALPLICYEAVFPQDVQGTSERPDFLLHLTNDAWFGTRAGPYQHLQQSRLRAIENGLPLVRVANTGVSAMIDPAGRILAKISLGQAGMLDARLPAPGQVTLYARSGDWPMVPVLLALCVLAAWQGRRANRH